jgi:hypothetical protein
MSVVWDRVVEAHVALNHPVQIDAPHILNALICFVVAFAAVAIFDRLVARRFKRTYFALHVFANVIITWFSFGGLLRTLAYPASSTLPGPDGPVSQLYMIYT